MAKVKCIYCKQQFDREKEPFKEVKPRRYAHLNCAKNFAMLLSKEEKAELALETYIENLFGEQYVSPRVRSQLKTYYKPPYKYTAEGILKSLKYWYEVKKADIKKANGGIGIVPSIYKEANNYYEMIYLANLRNQKTQKIEKKVIEIHIAPPERKINKTNKFTFLDEEENND